MDPVEQLHLSGERDSADFRFTSAVMCATLVCVAGIIGLSTVHKSHRVCEKCGSTMEMVKEQKQ